MVSATHLPNHSALSTVSLASVTIPLSADSATICQAALDMGYKPIRAAKVIVTYFLT